MLAFPTLYSLTTSYLIFPQHLNWLKSSRKLKRLHETFYLKFEICVRGHWNEEKAKQSGKSDFDIGLGFCWLNANKREECEENKKGKKLFALIFTASVETTLLFVLHILMFLFHSHFLSRDFHINELKMHRKKINKWAKVLINLKYMNSGSAEPLN